MTHVIVEVLLDSSVMDYIFRELRDNDFEIIPFKPQPDRNDLETFSVYAPVHSASSEFVENKIRSIVAPFAKHGQVRIEPSSQEHVFLVGFYTTHD